MKAYTNPVMIGRINFPEGLLAGDGQYCLSVADAVEQLWITPEVFSHLLEQIRASLTVYAGVMSLEVPGSGWVDAVRVTEFNAVTMLLVRRGYEPALLFFNRTGRAAQRDPAICQASLIAAV